MQYFAAPIKFMIFENTFIDSAVDMLDFAVSVELVIPEAAETHHLVVSVTTEARQLVSCWRWIGTQLSLNAHYFAIKGALALEVVVYDAHTTDLGMLTKVSTVFNFYKLLYLRDTEWLVGLESQ